ncbi:DUF4286 family protein [Sphingobacterium sp. lm-10]|uniref:DUF4286 family protein n=1 Tax=Sphingobacterium sp. lm-10 TaxID=2944904 RepID=UPI002020CC7E|nr:DUF4286 family protein [Sphingobacterium sp. lm-10]MCL7989259.1 DUF4286 family protein [Sphingobacterium sp. lm-10]
MYLYNISIILEESAHADTLNWINSTYLPALSLNHNPQFLTMLDSPHEGHTYCLQVKFSDQDALENFKAQYMPELQNYLATHHAERAFLFDSTMQYL